MIHIFHIHQHLGGIKQKSALCDIPKERMKSLHSLGPTCPVWRLQTTYNKEGEYIKVLCAVESTLARSQTDG